MKKKRNSPCPCGSGKKYKKCCAFKRVGDEQLFLKSGISLAKEGKHNEAVSEFQKALSANPECVESYMNLGVIYDKNNLIDKALSCFQQALSFDQLNPTVLYNLGVVYDKMGVYENSSDCFEKLLEITPDYPFALFKLGIIYEKMNKLQEAIHCFEKNLSINPEFLTPHYCLAAIYEKKNDLDKAKLHLLKSKDCKETKILNLTLEAVIHYRENDFQEALDILNKIEHQDNSAKIYNLYGKIYDRLGEEQKAFEYFTKSNFISQKNSETNSNDYAKYSQDLDKLKKRYTKKWLKTWTKPYLKKDNNPTPVFLVAFPRSGTTLLDQILGTHPDIEVLEEWPMLEKITQKNPALDIGSDNSLAYLNENDIKDLREQYYELARPFLPQKLDNKIIVDKMPLNILRIGLINRIFPEAKIVLALRHPFDVCLSNFMQDFKINEAMSNMTSLEGTADFYAKVMGLWQQYIDVLDYEYHIVKYENMVENLGPEMKKLLSFLDVPWDDEILNYYQYVNKRGSIKTPSYQDISKPIFTRARYRWKRYEEYLEPVKDTLTPFVKKFGYSIE